jgi:hypothetical protein
VNLLRDTMDVSSKLNAELGQGHRQRRVVRLREKNRGTRIYLSGVPLLTPLLNNRECIGIDSLDVSNEIHAEAWEMIRRCQPLL